MLTIISYHGSFFFLVTDLYFLISAVIVQIEELVKPTGIPTKEAEPEMEIHPLTVENKLSKCSTNFKFSKTF